MKVIQIINILESFAPTALQENFDNCGLITGSPDMEATGAILCIDITENIVDEAIKSGHNIIIAHHPLIFKGIKKINGTNYIERCIQKAIKNDIALYAAHTNFDIVNQGVSWKMAEKLNLNNIGVLVPKTDVLYKVVTFVPHKYLKHIKIAASEAGAGHIGNYDFCSYSSEGEGSFRALEGANPFVGEAFEVHTEQESRVEWIAPVYMVDNVVRAIKTAHPYEEPAIDIYPLKNKWENYGLGVVGELQMPTDEREFLQKIKEIFGTKAIKHSPLLNKKIVRVALCGGSGADFISHAKRSGADIYITGDVGYHKFFEAENQIVIADIGHFESEQYTKEIFYNQITKKIPNFAIRFSETEKNIVSYF